MSNLLDEAIIDAKALREAALKNAETIVIEKYSNEVKKTLEELLEQEDTLAALGIEGGEEAAADPAAAPAAEPTAAEPATETAAPESETEQTAISEDDIPLAATDDFSDLDGKNLNDFPESGEETELNIDLGALQENLENLASESEEEISLEELLSSHEINEEDSEESEVRREMYPDGKGGFIDPEEEQRLIDKKKGRKGRDPKTGKPIEEGDDDDEVSEDMNPDALVDAIMEKLTVDMGA
ncbi:MAG: hypothetical protein CMF52_07370, partial [Legionellales bacterium]|nr:hypothetical protein [Legionellales bacterium]